MLIAIFLSIVFVFHSLVGGSQTAYGELMSRYALDEIKSEVVDAEPRKQALAELKQLKKDIHALDLVISDNMKSFTKLIKDYHSTPADFDQLLAGQLVVAEQHYDALWTARQALLAHIQPDEWNRIVHNAQVEMKAREKK